MKNINQVILGLGLFLLTACGHRPSATGVYLAEMFHNKSLKSFDTAAYHQAIQKELKLQKGRLVYRKAIQSFFKEQQKNDSAWIMTLMQKKQLESLQDYIRQVPRHGLTPEIFYISKIDSLKREFLKGKFDSLPQVYKLLARLEVLSANAFLSYTSKLKYGVVDPEKIYSRYLIQLKTPSDSLFISWLGSKNWPEILKEVQPHRKEYVLLQKALDTCRSQPLRLKILLNMERYRWQIPADSDRFIQVNIPSFELKLIDSSKIALVMKVCVGEKREEDYTEKRKVYLLTKKIEDKPKNHETPILYGKINTIQLNPNWNIPHSIAQTEILGKSKRDPYYLENSGIKVYTKNGKLVDPWTVDWERIDPNHVPYSFKQAPGDGNALGKFKFNFPNKSSVYLHDTPNKAAFKLSNRAVSHGCVRVEEPLILAKALVNSPRLYDEIRMETGFPPIDTLKMDRYQEKQENQALKGRKTRWIAVDKKWPIFIDYYTCVPNGNGTLTVYADIYDYDSILLDSLKRYMLKENK